MAVVTAQVSLPCCHTYTKELFTQWPPGMWEWKLEVCFLPMVSVFLSLWRNSIFLPVFLCCREWIRSLGRGWRKATHWV